MMSPTFGPSQTAKKRRRGRDVWGGGGTVFDASPVQDGVGTNPIPSSLIVRNIISGVNSR
ncbi:hypothetical protein HanIR_Chr06g0293911 [Helianthus annuus]|nr:hypothetical protein HanIR_Chr06g0293911 [Helianthus annuus]